ncbi:MAG TPA: hypothetical protein VGK37_17045 [Casimicrobiaceae bacterium]|jgi:hypothetical protein
MADKSIAAIQHEIDAVAARVRSEREHLHDGIDATRAALRHSVSSRRGQWGLFAAALVIGAAAGLRVRAISRRSRSRRGRA